MARINDEIIEQCRKMYEEDHIPCAQIARHFGIGSATVRRRLKELGVEIIKHPHAGKFDINEVIELYNQGTQIWKIANMFKSSEETISKVLKENGVTVKVKPCFNENIFDEIDTEEKAYWLGFIWADGCVIRHNEARYSYAFELNISIKDYGHLEKFCEFLSLDKSRIKIRDAKTYYCKERQINSGKSCRVQISNKHLWNTLNNYGCCPDKTHNEKFPDLQIFKTPDLVIPFIRGVVDGDGWVYVSGKNYLICGVCGQEQFLKGLMNVLPEEFRTISLYKDPSTDVIRFIRYAHLKAIKLVNILYANSSIYLDRKFNIAAPYICKDISKLGNIGETPEMDNTEINSEITKGFESL